MDGLGVFAIWGKLELGSDLFNQCDHVCGWCRNLAMSYLISNFFHLCEILNVGIGQMCPDGQSTPCESLLK